MSKYPCLLDEYVKRWMDFYASYMKFAAEIVEKAIKDLEAQGIKPTNKKLAEVLKCSPRHIAKIKKYMKKEEI